MTDNVPEIVVTLAPVLEATDPAEHPLLIAMLERWAGERYRQWADAVGDIAEVTDLLACAEREDAIATLVEERFEDAAGVQERLAAAHPLLRGALEGAMTWRPIDEQYATQAEAERLGAATWRSFAKRATAAGDDDMAHVYERCAALEEASADVLERLLR